MKIIQANKFFYPKGGADKYFLTLTQELTETGDLAIPFAMTDNKNLDSIWSKYFSENINYYQTKNYFKLAWRLIWNQEAANKFGKLLDETKPDLVHAHNIYHQLSPAILSEAKKRHIPVIMTLHDYKLICPNYLLYTHKHHCERCLTGNYLNCLTHNCYNSYSRSGLAALESFLHNKVWHSYRNNTDLFIAPSLYLKELMIKAGWNQEKIIVLNNPAPEYQPQKDGKRLLYIGRLAPEKGINTLIEALKLTEDNLDIAGSGPKEDDLKKLSKKLGLENRITFHGQLSGETLEKLKREAKAIILPSVWSENMPLVLLEALAYDKLIIASRTGGTPELIENNKTGFLFTPENITELATAIKNLDHLTPKERELMSNNIRDKIVPLSLEKHLNRLRELYKQTIINN